MREKSTVHPSLLTNPLTSKDFMHWNACTHLGAPSHGTQIRKERVGSADGGEGDMRQRGGRGGRQGRGGP